MVNSHGRFVWYELMTTDIKIAKAFYASVVGWGTRDASAPGSAYSLFVGRTLPRPVGGGPCWLGHIEGPADYPRKRLPRPVLLKRHVPLPSADRSPAGFLIACAVARHLAVSRFAT